jgi:hypothetical protein
VNHLALMRGLDPGEFRYAAPVALDESRFSVSDRGRKLV